MSGSRKKRLGRLLKAQRRGVPVFVAVASKRLRPRFGYVVAVTDKWFAMHLLIEGLFLDEIAFYRIRDVKKVWADPTRSFTQHVVAELGIPIAQVDLATNAGTRDVMERAASYGGWVTLFHRDRKADYWWSEDGIVLDVGQGRAEFLRLDDLVGGGEFADRESGLRPFKAIWQIRFGGRRLKAFEKYCGRLGPLEGRPE